MSSNFDFLQGNEDSMGYFRAADFLEQEYAMGNYASELTSARKIAENVVKFVLDQNYMDNDATFAQNLKTVKYHHLLNQQLVDLLYAIKQPGNEASHTLEQYNKQDGVAALQQVIQLMYWFAKTYCDYEGAVQPFVEPSQRSLYTTSERHVIYSLSGDNSDGNWPRYTGLEKVGETTASQDLEKDWSPNSDYLRSEAHHRISQYMKTSGVPYNLDWVELAHRKVSDTWFDDHDVHRVLLKSGFKRDAAFEKQGAKEWFQVNADQVKQAIAAVKNGRESIDGPVQATGKIELRPEQQDAVDKTAKTFKTKYKMLWNAKMRFGKTLSALKLIKKENYAKVLIMTHRPVVAEGWFDDFEKIGMPESGYKYGSKREQDLSLEALQREAEKYVYFASIQDLRGSEAFGGTVADKNQLVKDIQWDLVIIDEAHEGTQTDLAQQVIDGVVTPKYTRVLELSGTPFNLLNQYDADEVFTWDYVMEQQAKYSWDSEHPNGERNPYVGLPSVSMYTFEIKNRFKSPEFLDDDKSFNFREFFKVDDETGKFVYADKVNKFLDNISSRDERSNYPFSTLEFRNNLRHTLWLMPSVKSAKAMKTALENHPVFGVYNVVNIVDKDTSDSVVTATDSDLKRVNDAITNHPARTYTITLTVRKMTTGVTIKPWTGVLFLSNTNSAMQYLQAAFRAQTPYEDEEFGRKTNCYIFDFAPDRALKVMAASRQMSTGVGKLQTSDQRAKLGELLNFLPIIGEEGQGMQAYQVDTLLTQLKKVYAEKAVQSGFDDDSLYNDELLKLTNSDLEIFNDIKAIVGQTKAEKKPDTIDVNHQGLDDEQYEKAIRAEKKPKKERSEEEQADIDRKNALKKQRKSMISVLRGISIRIPMMIYGMDIDIDQKVDINKFVDLVDSQSWSEFMPQGITKDKFRQISKYYDPEVFIEAGRIIRHRVKELDQLDPIERTLQIADVFSTFKNPDKETVLTPWRVVNMQLGKTIGGYSFFDDAYQNSTKDGKQIAEWRTTDLTEHIFNNDAHILEINSKTGLYPLYVATSLYYREFQKLNEVTAGKFSAQDLEDLWADILYQNIFAVAKTPMAKTIAERTLTGYKHYETHIVYVDGIVETARQSIDAGVKKIKEAFKYMKFDVVIGNPPYQQTLPGDNDTYSRPIYHLFMDLSYGLSEKVVLITPARFLFNAGSTPVAWNRKMLHDKHLRVVQYEPISSNIFPHTDIKGGVAITLRDTEQSFGEVGTFTAYDELKTIISKVRSLNSQSFSTCMYAPEAYKFTSEMHSVNPRVEKMLSKGHANDLKSNVLDKLSGIIFFDRKPSDKKKYVQILGLKNKKRSIMWIDSSFISYPENFLKYKVFLPKSNGNGNFGERLSAPIIGEPGLGATQTFMSIGKLDSEDEAKAVVKYIQSKFVRALLGVLKVTQDNPASKWSEVPMQDFSKNSDIDWKQSVSKIDRQLYVKYGLSESEANFIESTVQEMKL